MNQLFTPTAYAMILNEYIQENTLKFKPYYETGIKTLCGVKALEDMNSVLVMWREPSQTSPRLCSQLVEYATQEWSDIGQQVPCVRMLRELNSDLVEVGPRDTRRDSRIIRNMKNLLEGPYPLKSITMGGYTVFTFALP